MAARGSKSAQRRTDAERARLHAARREWHDAQIRRRVRDNTIAVVVGAVLVAGAIGSQVVHAQVAPAPEPDPGQTVAPTDAPQPTDTSAPSEQPVSPAPTDAPSDAPAE